MSTTPFLTIAISLACGLSAAKAQSFYKDPKGLFSTRPSETKSLTNLKRCGPVGMGIDLIQPAFTMRISHIEDGSPAAATGKLQAGQIIESINGQKLADIDPRIQLGQIIAGAEATDGVIKLMVVEKPGAKAEEVTVNIPVLGAYRIYINGKLLIESKHGVGRREGGRPRGAFITKDLEAGRSSTISNLGKNSIQA